MTNHLAGHLAGGSVFLQAQPPRGGRRVCFPIWQAFLLPGEAHLARWLAHLHRGLELPLQETMEQPMHLRSHRSNDHLRRRPQMRLNGSWGSGQPNIAGVSKRHLRGSGRIYRPLIAVHPDPRPTLKSADLRLSLRPEPEPVPLPIGLSLRCW